MKRLILLIMSSSIFLLANSMEMNIVEISVAHSSSSDENNDVSTTHDSMPQETSKKEIETDVGNQEIESQASRQSTPEAPVIIPKEQERILSIDNFASVLGCLGSHSSLDDYTVIYSAISQLPTKDFNALIEKHQEAFSQFLTKNKHVALKESEKQKLLIDVLLLMSKSYVSDHQSLEAQLSKSNNTCKQYANKLAQYLKKFRISIGGLSVVTCWAIIATYFAIPK